MPSTTGNVLPTDFTDYHRLGKKIRRDKKGRGEKEGGGFIDVVGP